MNSSGEKQSTKLWRWFLYCLLLAVGTATGAVSSLYLQQKHPETVDFSKQKIPSLMMHPLGREGAFVHQAGNWEILTSLISGNDSIVLKYNNQFIMALSAAPDRTLESIVINHPRHDTVLLILEDLNRTDHPGKLTTDILSSDGKKIGFVIDENMDGQPDLRFEYAGPYLYVWLDEAWRRVMRTSPRRTGGGFKHTVIYKEKMHLIHLEQFPYLLEPLTSDARGDQL